MFFFPILVLNLVKIDELKYSSKSMRKVELTMYGVKNTFNLFRDIIEPTVGQALRSNTNTYHESPCILVLRESHYHIEKLCVIHVIISQC